MTVIRPAILALERNGIGEVSMLGLGRTDIIPLWFGEGDVVTPDFIRDAAKRALDQGKTFYTFTRGLTELREAIAIWASRQSGRAIDLDRVTVPGAAMMGVQIALQCVCEPGDNVLIISPMWPNIFQAVPGLGAQRSVRGCHLARPMRDGARIRQGASAASVVYPAFAAFAQGGRGAEQDDASRFAGLTQLIEDFLAGP